MSSMTWSSTEKKIARRVFDAALERELAEIMAAFKERAAKATRPEEMWAVEKYLAEARRGIEKTYDYRYSQLHFVFGRLLREKRIEERDLEGLSEDHLAAVRRIASF